ncbi:MAG TPA: alpha-isopropylmalate synthase regulatory domain-containing protein, partial [Gemmata sp.]
MAHDKALMTKILHAVQDLENIGYEFESAEASFDLLVRKVAKDHKPWQVDKSLTLYKPWFERVSYRVNIEARENGEPVTEGTVRLKVAGVVEHTASEGDGPVNALDGALRKALVRFYPRLQEMLLVDYKVRVVNPKEGTAARVRVVIESRDSTDVWGTVGVSENIIEASWLALCDSIEFKLFKDMERDQK